MKASKLLKSSNTKTRGIHDYPYYRKYYAVAVDKVGPKAYGSWEECKVQISKWPCVQNERFITLESGPGVDTKMLLPRNAPSIFDHDSAARANSIQYNKAVAKSNPARISVTLPFSLRGLSRKKLPNASHTFPFHARGNWSQANNMDRGFVFVNSTSRTSPSYIQELLRNQALHAPKKHTPPEVTYVLSPEQQEVLDIVKAGDNVFFTGPAGTGKSVLLREIIKLRGGRGSQEIGITAPTGIAAVNIEGVTLHSWGGIGLGRRRTSALIRNILSRANFKSRWTTVKTLIIDEISMVDGSLFNQLEEIARGVRGDERPFGGIQLVLSGDFCQLPPVSQRDSRGEVIPAKFAFEADNWKSCVDKLITLKQVFRQKDEEFVEILNAMRFGRVSEKAKVVLTGLSREVEYDDGVEPTELFPTRREVDSANHSRLQKLPGPTYTYVGRDSAGKDSNGRKIGLDEAEDLLGTLIVPGIIRLRVGAQVMLIKNIFQGVLVNGTVGRITGFISIGEAFEEKIEILESYSDRFGSTFYNHRYAYRQGDFFFDDAKNRNLRQLLWPVVDFTMPSGEKRTVLCIPSEFTIDNAMGGMEAMREQVPIILAWALSVHKSQGQTLDRVKVNLARIFENGQAYCAISRATTKEHLQIVNFHESKVMAHHRVLGWYKKNDLDDSQLQDWSPDSEWEKMKILMEEMESDELVS